MEGNEETSETSWESIKIAAENVLLPACRDFEDRPCEEKDFINFKTHVEKSFNTLFNQLEAQSKVNIDGNVKPSVVAVLLACGEHSEQNQWTTDLSIKYSTDVQKKLCQLCSCDNIKQLIISGPIMKQCLLALRIKLVRDSWKQHRAAVVCFKWILLQLQMPQLGEILPDVFPATLLILDDFEIDNKVLGCWLIEHIINNVTRAELRRFQYDDVAYDALQRLLYQRDAELVVPLITCLSTLLLKMDASFTQNLEMSRLDRSLQVLLGHMEMEQGLALRQAYAVSLPLLLKAGGVSLVRWSQRLLRVFAEYLSIEDNSHGQTQLHTLQSMLTFLQHTWPRAASLAPQSLSSLLRILYELTQPQSTLVVDAETKQLLLANTEKCLQLLAATAPKPCLTLLNGTETLCFTPEFHEIMDRVKKTASEAQ